MLFIGMQHISTVCDEIRESCKKWYNLGLKLEIDRKALDGIKSHNTSATLCLKQVVVEWLKLNSNLSSLPTWSHLIKAIAQIKMERVAKALQQSHPVPRRNTSGREHLIVACDDPVCVRHYALRFVTYRCETILITAMSSWCAHIASCKLLLFTCSYEGEEPSLQEHFQF